MAYQRAFVPTKHIYIGQGYGLLSKTHKYSYALDLSGDYSLFAPFDCKVTKKYNPVSLKKAKEVWLTSTKKVLCSNGYYGYLTMSITHPKGINKLEVGQTFKQYDSLGLTTTEMTGSYSGNHAHIELSLGKETGWDKNIIDKYGEYVNVNRVKPEEYLFATEDSKIIKETYKLKTYHFIKQSEITYKVVNVSDPPLYIRDKETNNVIGKLYNGNEVLKFNNNTRCLVYHYDVLGLTYKKYLKKL